LDGVGAARGVAVFGSDGGATVQPGQASGGDDFVRQAGFVDLGSMKGNKGNQNYEIPANIDVNKFRNVAIWCARFGVNFAQATLDGPALSP